VFPQRTTETTSRSGYQQIREKHTQLHAIRPSGWQWALVNGGNGDTETKCSLNQALRSKQYQALRHGSHTHRYCYCLKTTPWLLKEQHPANNQPPIFQYA
jgi:hypothetical protein